MSTNNVILVLGYNNTRVNDVKTIREKAKEYLNAKTVLCKKFITQEDKNVADFTIDVGLQALEENILTVMKELNKYAVNVIALLPFSDQGTQLAGALSKNFLYLKCPHPIKVHAALDKYIFRELEQKANNAPKGYKKILSEKVISFEQLLELYKKQHGKIFLKPAKEGNSRGCINLLVEKDIQSAWNKVSIYLSDGIVVESLIENAIEYSWDHVNGYEWVTEKKSTENQYRAEYQQIVPAPLGRNSVNIISAAGKFMAEISGSNGGVSHNEVFYDPTMSEVYGVEPNLRPAGMRVWDLARLAFENFDSWAEWVLWAAGKSTPANIPLKRLYYAGIRMIAAPKDGIIKEFQDITVADLRIDNVEFFDLVWTKKVGDRVVSIAQDNAGYIGYIIARSKHYEDLSKALDAISMQLANSIEIQ